MKVPMNVCLPNLRTLHLSYLRIVDDPSFLRLISGCPVLEDLGICDCSIDDSSELSISSLSLKSLVLDFDTLVDISTYRGRNDFDHTIVIDAPSLVYFEYFCLAAAGYTLNMGSLETADITIFHYSDEDRERSVGLLQGICNAQVLRLSVTDFDALLFRPPPVPVLAFNNLVELKFMNPCEYRMVSVTWTVEFLCCAPNLKTFTLVLGGADVEFESLPEEVPSCLLYHLKEISIIHYRGVTHMFEIVIYFLKHASVLEKLAVSSINALHECGSSKGYTLRIIECLEKADEQSATLLQGICSVRTLLFRMRLDSGIAFHNLFELEFKNPCETWIVEFLHCAPNLKTLTLDLTDVDRTCSMNARPTIRELVRWKQSSDEWCKLNSDSVISVGSEASTCGDVVRDAINRWLIGYARCLCTIRPNPLSSSSAASSSKKKEKANRPFRRQLSPPLAAVSDINSAPSCRLSNIFSEVSNLEPQKQSRKLSDFCHRPSNRPVNPATAFLVAEKL
ncbi:hypothetical protein V6N12_012558 [Hibiscus sabdariffa]|uniref:FBD domain-containing protein n=1 Tax=Hibiscus sabdariffa TaxID=183260 RepID=A0ABR2B5H8_9ROSI